MPYSAYNVVAEDLDNDGDPDLVIPNYGTDKVITVLLNQGDGTWEPVNYAAGTQVMHATVGDLNGDTWPDIVYSNYGAGTLGILINNGSGAFTTKPDVSTAGSPAATAIADLNEDGDVDLAVASKTQHTVSVIPGNGDGTFGARVDLTTAFTNAASVVVGDLNGDTKLDLVAGSTNKTFLMVWTNNSAGGLLNLTPQADVSLPDNVTWVEIALMNGDTDGDLVASASGSKYVYTALGNGDGTFQAATSHGVGSNPAYLATGFVDGDAFLDVVTAGTLTTATVLMGKGDGTYQAKVDYPLAGHARGVDLADVTGDGELDMVVSQGTAESVGILINDGSGVFPGDPLSYTTLSNPRAVTAGDLDADGRVDLVTVHNAATNGANVLLQDGAGDFSSAAVLPQSGSSYNVALEDLDGDLKPDVIVASEISSGGHVGVYRNTTTTPGTFTFATRVDTPLVSQMDTRGLVVADLDGDGKLDVASADSYSSGFRKAWVWRNTSTVGTINLAAGVGFEVGYDPEHIAGGDLDGDDKVDLVVANSASSDSVSVLRNTSTPGTLSFEAKQDFDVDTDPRSVAVGDINGDTKPDVVVARDSSDKVSVFINTSTGAGVISFAARVDYDTGDNPYFIDIVDVNGDGHPDVTTTNNTDDNVSVLLNDGAGGFAGLARMSWPTENAPWVGHFTDLDGDGIVDYAAAGYSSNQVVVVKGSCL